MFFSVVDARGLLIAVVAGACVVVLPGLALARLFGFSRNRDATADWLTGTVIGLAVLPAIDSLATRALGLDAAAVLTLALAATGAVILLVRRSAAHTVSGWALALIGVWLALLVFEWIDFDFGGRLYQPLMAVDTVKHAATTQAILDTGAPPRDAFFLRPERASYYYFFYTLTALVERFCLGWVDAKSAVGGVVFWVGIGLFGVVRLAMTRAGIELPSTGKRMVLLVAAVLAIGGLDVLALLFIAWRNGYWMADPVQWNAQISIWSSSVLWVPHHVSALVAGIVGLVVLSDLADAPNADIRRTLRGVLLAALCFVASLGLSVWVTLALVATAGIWGLLLLVERQWRMAALLASAGILAILIAAQQILDLHAGRSGPLPIIVEVREFAPVDALFPEDPWRAIMRLTALPLNYFIEFGALSVGTVLFWQRRLRDGVPLTTFARVLVISTLAGLLLGSTFRSLIFNNDLGWRVMLFPLLAATVWTIAAVGNLLAERAARPRPAWRAIPIPLAGLAIVGWATSAAILVSMRAYPWLPVNPNARFIAADPQTERALRVAYAWADAHLPSADVLQHNPGRRRALAFGMYSRNPIALSDRYGSLYGADFEAVHMRLESLTPIYNTQGLTDAAVRAIAAASRIDHLVVTAADPIWSQEKSFVWHAEPVYASERVRIIPVAALGG